SPVTLSPAAFRLSSSMRAWRLAAASSSCDDGAADALAESSVRLEPLMTMPPPLEGSLAAGVGAGVAAGVGLAGAGRGGASLVSFELHPRTTTRASGAASARRMAKNRPSLLVPATRVGEPPAVRQLTTAYETRRNE